MTPQAQSLVIATAGHIDHGKTTLVRALTGINTDRLPEEKRRGITIDLGFAAMEIEQPDGAPLRVSFVDVPGHSLFVRNMLAGAGCVPAAMLVIAADEGIKPQTVEHLAICELLGINYGITVITKMDAVSHEHLDQVKSNIGTFLRDTFLGRDDAPILAVSAQTGAGVAALRAELVKLARRLQAGNSDAALRLPIDRSFVMKGFGTVVTGTLLSGVIHEGQALVVEPGARSVRVRGLQTHGRPERSVQAGLRVAVNLSGIDVSDVHRGQTLVAPHTLAPVDAIDAEVSILATAPALKHRARIHLHAFTSEVMATASVYGYEDVRPGTTALMRIKLDQPVVLSPGDRFVLRQPSPVATIGGGRVLDCTPEPRQRKSATLAFLEQLRRASIPEQLVLLVKRRGTAGIRLDTLAREAGLALDATRRHLDSALQQSDILVVEGQLLLSRVAMQQATNQILTLLHPRGASGVKASELRSQAALSPEVFHFLVAELGREQKVLMRGESISLDAGPAVSAPESRQLAAVAQTYQAAGLASPLVSELAQRFCVSETEMRRLITLLQRDKTIVRMGSDDLFIHARAIENLISRMAPLRGTLIDVARFKELTGLSRKYAIPLLEYLDRGRITRKQGDQRLVL